MMHFTCDQCGKEMRPDEGEARYEIRIEARAAHVPTRLTDEDLDSDHIDMVSDMLCNLEEGEESPLLPPAKSDFRYDLCGDCYERFLLDPLGKEAGQNLSFSKN